MFVAAPIHEMLIIPNTWNDRAIPHDVGAVRQSASLPPSPMDSEAAIKVVAAEVGSAWSRILLARKTAETAYVSDELKAKLRAVMWALEQIDIR